MVRWSSVLAFAVIGLYAVILYVRDPAQGGFPMCPFRWLTGWECPGCGSQRAMHDLMHGRVAEAFGHNAMLVISIPLLIAQWAASRFISLAKPLAAQNLIVYAWAVVIIGWGVIRNL